MTIRARWVISECGLQSLSGAGITTGWLRAWLHTAGADEVTLSLLEAGDWQHENDDWQLFFATESELESVRDSLPSTATQTSFKLDNPLRRGNCFRHGGVISVLMPPGDIAFQRQIYLNLLNDNKPMRPLYVCADETQGLPLETGLSATLEPTTSPALVNHSGLLIEEQVIALLREHALSLRTVESCTGGLIAARLCRVPGASDVVDRGWVTYTNAAKQDMAGVPESLIRQHGAVSEQVVRAMAEGCAALGCVSVAVSGIAGPGGGSPGKPVGTVWIAVSMAGCDSVSRCLQLSGARHEIQAKTVVAALLLLTEAVET
ncbi:CinA family protein [Mariprofundus ferrooxydans]|uniref:CinA-like protein n=1 Tax=Mariprofundus ferrooxydans PV-1 TaxID=314345 RepID=Q0F398_9PROT|nr:CinA family protein [Mariprofundus ferrooxydans]EAU56043.1 CinA-like protein [Mariprofundus ferrooxydans PV-1]KON46630.1 damage-inducible protein CinA [Mariprofundus ferrooxydans]